MKEVTRIFDFYLVFSGESEKKSFRDADLYNCLVYNHPKNKRKQNIPGYKKFYALDYLKNKNYDYVVCSDSEIDVLLHNFTKENVLRKLDDFYENKIIYGGDVSEIKDKLNLSRLTDIIEKSASILGTEIKSYIDNLNKDGSWYYWWSDIPVFKSKDINDFLNQINYYCNNFTLVKPHFDHKIYCNFLLYKNNFRLYKLSKELVSRKVYGANKWSLEKIQVDKPMLLEKLRDLKYGFSFVNSIQYDKNKEFFDLNGTFMLFNVDRNKKRNV